MGYCIPPFMVWNKGRKNERVTSPRLLGGPGTFGARDSVMTKNSSFEERRERPRPVAWPKTPPGQYQPSPMFGFTPKRGVKKSQTGECFCEVLPYRPLNGPKGAILSGITGGKPRIGAKEVF